MIDVKQAIANARDFAREVLSIEFLPGIDQILLEEVRSDNDHFDITLSFPQRESVNPIALHGREFKTFRVNKSSGEVEGMSIRQLA